MLKNTMAKSGSRGRWSWKRKTEVVLRILRGEELDALSRELGVKPGTLSSWRDAFLLGGEQGLKSRTPDARDEESRRLQAKVGELTMGCELLDEKIPGVGVGFPPRTRRSRLRSQTSSISAKRVYGLARVCKTWQLNRSSIYARRARRRSGFPPPKKRGPVGACTDAELVRHSRQVLEKSPWVGEGYRKVHARLRHKGIRTSSRRVLRVMRENSLLAHQRPGRRRGPRAHDRSITPDQPDVLWGTDATSTLTGVGNATIFFVVDHCTAECLGIHAARRGTRHEALEPLRQAVWRRFNRFAAGVAPEGLGLRHDHGSQFISHTFQSELAFLGIRSTPSFVRERMGNGYASHCTSFVLCGATAPRAA